MILNRKRRDPYISKSIMGGNEVEFEEFPHMVIFNYKYTQSQNRYSILLFIVVNI